MLNDELGRDLVQAIEHRRAVLGHKSGIANFDGYSEVWTKKLLWSRV